MRRRVAGLSLIGLIIGLIIFAMAAVFGMKVIPSFMEFRAAKNAIVSIARERPNATPPEIRRAFENRATIDGIETPRPEQLEIGKGTISFAYRKEVPLFSNVGLYIDYQANTAGGQ